MVVRHKADNEEWIESKTKELEQEKTALREERQKLQEEVAQPRAETGSSSN